MCVQSSTVNLSFYIFLLLTIVPANELLDWHRAGRLSNEALYKTTLPPSQAFPVHFNYLISKLR